jgi:serine/threonine protein kinase
MLFGHLPFEDQALKNRPNPTRPNRKSSVNVYQLYQYISRNTLDIPKHVSVSAEAIDLIKGMLRSDPEKRMTLSEVFRHSWFANSQLI